MRKHKKKIIAGVIIVVILAFAFLWCDNAAGPHSHDTQNSESTKVTKTEELSKMPENSPSTEPFHKADEQTETDRNADLEEDIPLYSPSQTPSKDVSYSEQNGMDINDDTGKDEYQTEPVSEGKPVPVEPENTVISDKELTCTMSVRCDTILENIAQLDKEKAELVPKDGVIYKEQKVTFYEGESVFNLLVREMKRNKIHLEFENTPIYNSAYIEGIGNLYEFDCGELSGWMYRVNGWFPNYGCSRYQLKAGDKVEWVYTCDLGRDIGGDYSSRNGK